MSFPIPALKGQRVILREVIPEDRVSYLAHAGEREAAWGFGGEMKDVGPKAPEQADRWLKGRPGWMHWVITVDGRHIGTVSLHDLVESDRRVTLAIGIMSAGDMNQGFGTEAMKLVLAHGFGEMKLHRIDLRVLARNKRAIRAYEKCGFVHEGVQRQVASIDGRWEDDLMMSVLEHEFEP
ncbi:MAG: GNAT family N-acetyltransferase [Chloroflexi bacterium]|nr:GNAT family N-acetyltransferase [Chloroflexota bacterium]